MGENKYIITHYQRKSPNPYGWFETSFITTRVDKSGEYYWGYDENKKIEREEVLYNEQKGTFKRIESIIGSNGDKSIWIADNGEVWLANTKDPLDIKGRRMIETYLSPDLLSDEKILTQLKSEPIGLDLGNIKSDFLPLIIKQSLNTLLKNLRERPELIRKLKGDTISIIDPTYIQKLNRSISKLKNNIKSDFGEEHVNDPKGEQVFEATENKVYYNSKTLFLYPYFLDQNRIGVNGAGVIPYAKQTAVAIAIHRENHVYQLWEDMRSNKQTELNTTSKLSDINLDRLIQSEDKDFSINWLKKLIQFLYEKSDSEIHSVRGYIFHSIIQQFAEEHLSDNTRMGEILKISTDTENFSKPDAKLPFYREVRPTENLNHNQILLLDPADAFGVSQNGKRTFKEVWDDYDILYVHHGLDIPVGIGFSLYSIPKLLENNYWETLQKTIWDEFYSYRKELKDIGVDLLPKEEIKYYLRKDKENHNELRIKTQEKE